MPPKYRVVRNEYGGFYVVDQHGGKAPRPFGFTSRENAELRVMRLNTGGSLPSRDSQGPKEDKTDA